MNGISILIVEDDAALGEVLKGHLQSAGYEVAGPAPSCSAALELIWSSQPDLAFVDTYLGSETCATVIEECHLLGVPVIVTHSQADGAEPSCCTGHSVIGKGYTTSGLAEALALHRSARAAING